MRIKRRNFVTASFVSLQFLLLRRALAAGSVEKGVARVRGE